MVYSNKWRIFLLLCLIVFSGCTGKVKKQPTEKIEATEKAEITSIVAVANPYLTSNKKVTKEAVSAFNAALVSMQSEEWDLAEQQLTTLTQTYSDLSGPWVNLGLVYRHQKKWEEAAAAFSQASVINPLNNDAYVEFAVMQRENGKFVEAEQLYAKALQVWPHNAEALINLGILYDMYMGRFADALVQFELAQQLMPEPNQELDGWVIDIKRRLSK
jgi:tetratricopeptide (TPR) repeat protein